MREEGILPSQANLPRFSTSLVRSVRATRHLPRVNPKGTSQKKKPRRISAAPGLEGARLGAAFVLSHSPFTAGNKEHLILTRVEPG